MADCPNCAAEVEDGVRLCPSCGFDTGEAQAGRVRELREEGKIHPGRLSAEGRDDFHGEAIPIEVEEMPAEDTPLTNPEQIDSGM